VFEIFVKSVRKICRLFIIAFNNSHFSISTNTYINWRVNYEQSAKKDYKIKILNAEPHYGLNRKEIINLEIVQQKNRTTLFFEPPIRYLEI